MLRTSPETALPEHATRHRSRFTLDGVLGRVPFTAVAIVVCISVFAIALLLRWDVVTYAGRINPDEAELMAAGRRAAIQMFPPMATFTAPTFMILWPMSLGVLDLLGVPMNLRTAHLLSALAYATVVSIVLVATARRVGWVTAGLFAMPVAGWMLTIADDFKSLGTELPCVVILVASALLAFYGQRPIGLRRLALVAAMCSLAPWFKPQAVVLAACVVVAALAHAHMRRAGSWGWRGWARALSACTAGGLGPTVLIVGVMAAGGTLGLLWDEPIKFTFAYAFSRSEIELAQTPPIDVRLREMLHILATNLPAVGWALVGLGTWWSGRRMGWRGLVSRFTIWATPLAGGALTLLGSWPIYTHYLNFLFAGGAIAAIISTAIFNEDRTAADAGLRTTPNAAKHLLNAVAIVLAVLAVLGFLRAAVGARIPERHLHETALVDVCPRGSSVFVWGWAAELYAYNDWQPASRYVNSHVLQMPTSERGTYRVRLNDELKAHPPDCIVNAVGPAWFDNTSEAATLERVIPSTAGWLRACFRKHQVPLRDGSRVTVWTNAGKCRDREMVNRSAMP